MVRRHREDQREICDHRERNEAFGRMIGELGIDRGGDRHHAARADQERVAVRRLRRRVFGGETAAGASLVLDQNRLADVLLQLLPDQARKNVVATARGKTDDDVNGLARVVWIALRTRRMRGEDERENGQQRAAPCDHSHERSLRIAAFYAAFFVNSPVVSLAHFR
jgi:hypothetical protein